MRGRQDLEGAAHRRSTTAGRWSVAAPVLLALALAWWLTAPATVNGDGLGYLREVAGRDLVPGHLAYLPMLRALARLTRPAAPLDLEPWARGLSLLFALGGLALFYDAARRVRAPAAALFATALLGLSHAYFRSAQEVEVYAAAACAALAVLWALTRLITGPREHAPRWAATAGAALGLAVLCHLTLALLVIPVAIVIWRHAPGRRGRSLALAALLAAVVALPPFLLALRAEGRLAPAAAWAWLRSADHGIPYPHTVYTPLVATWGLARSLVHAPYPYEAPVAAVVALSAAALLAWAALVWMRRTTTRRSPSPALPDGRWLLAAWITPLALFGVAFYPSDTERWIFVLPLLALALAPAAGRAGLAVLGAIALLNFFSVELPQARDDSAPRRAAAVDRATRSRDLIISPGHGWDELLGLASPAPARRWILIYYVGAERSAERAVAKLRAEIAATFAAGGRPYVARLRDDTDPRGFKELAQLGLPPEAVAALFRPYRPRPTAVPGLWELSPP